MIPNKAKVSVLAVILSVSLCGCSSFTSPEDPVNIIRDSVDGAKAGKEQGLSAEDTTVEIIDERTKEIGKLTVMSATSDMIEYHSIGDDYAKLTITPVDIIFSIDLDDCEIITANDSITIRIPEPEPDIEIDITKKKLLPNIRSIFLQVLPMMVLKQLTILLSRSGAALQ